MPMFSSNQVFQISGRETDLETVLDFAVKQSGEHEVLTRTKDPVQIMWQITKNGLYCLGTAYSGKPEPGWNTYPFDYDPKIIAGIIWQWIENQPKPISEYDNCDGAHKPGFICQNLWGLPYETRASIQNPFYGFLTFQPFTNWYSK